MGWTELPSQSTPLNAKTVLIIANERKITIQGKGFNHRAGDFIEKFVFCIQTPNEKNNSPSPSAMINPAVDNQSNVTKPKNTQRHC